MDEKAAQFRANAQDCRKMARQSVSPAMRRLLESIAQTWELMAQDRENPERAAVTSPPAE
jgi:hypothetical protein